MEPSLTAESRFDEDLVERTGGLLRAAVARAIDGAARVDVLFSGGLDSAVLAALLAPTVPCRLVTIGVRGSHDLGAGREGAALLGRPWAPVEVDPARVEASLDRVAHECGALREPQRSLAVAFRIALEAADADRILCGQGADELFLGYAHFEGLSGSDLRARAAQDFQRLLDEDWPRTQQLARGLGRSLEAPYLDPGLVAWVQGIDPERRRPTSGTRKALLRAVGRWAGVPAALAQRPKRAIQYGSGISAVVRRVCGRPTGVGFPFSPG